MSTILHTTTETLFRELDFRESNGLEVSLLWNAPTDAVSVHVFDTGSNETFETEVPRDLAREAFFHPFTFIRARGMTKPID